MSAELVDGLTQGHVDFLSWIAPVGERWTHAGARSFFKTELLELEQLNYVEICEHLDARSYERDIEYFGSAQVDPAEHLILLLRLTERARLVCRLLGIQVRLHSDPPHRGISNRL